MFVPIPLYRLLPMNRLFLLPMNHLFQPLFAYESMNLSASTAEDLVTSKVQNAITLNELLEGL